MTNPPCDPVRQNVGPNGWDGDSRYRALFHNKTVGIVRCRILGDANGHPVNYVIEEANEAYGLIVGMPKRNIEGRLVTDVFPGVERAPFDFIGNLGRLGLQGGEMDCEVHLPAAGQWLSLYAYGSAPGECTALFTDITRQKRADVALRRQQAQLQAIIDNSPVLISMKDPQGVVILANQALLDLVGAERADDFVGRSVFELFPTQVAQELWANDLAALRGDAPVRAEEKVQDKTGCWRTYLTIKFPVRDTLTGESYGVCAISTDITEQQQSQADRSRLEAASSAKSELLATVSHEIRTHLNGVIGFTQLLATGPLNEGKRRYVDLSRESGESMLHLLNDFLDLAKIEGGGIQLIPVEFDPVQTVRQAMEPVQAVADRKGLKLQGACAVSGHVRGDVARLRQILLNYLSNAVKFTERGGVTLRCTEVSRADGIVWLNFMVSDTGIGIDAAAQETLFRPFVQAEASTARRFGGTGLGLAICKRLAEAMGGEVGLKSEPNEGSSFWVTLPFAVCA